MTISLAALPLLAMVVPPPSLSSRSQLPTPRAPSSAMFFGGLVARFNPAAAEDLLFNLVETGGSKKEILDAFKKLEAADPTPDDLLLSERGVALADGRWMLLGSIAAKVGGTSSRVTMMRTSMMNATMWP